MSTDTKWLDINNYTADGFVKVCNVKLTSYVNNFWGYSEQDRKVLYSPHTSWVYAICVDNQIYKIGETGNPLGIESSLGGQPVTGTKSRLGRYMRGCGTDEYIRASLQKEVLENRVSIWARKCETFLVETIIAGTKEKTVTTTHKDLEIQYLDYIKKNTGRYPVLNKARK